MNKEQFWEIIDAAREKAGDWKQMYEPLREALSNLEASDIVHWRQILYEYQGLSDRDELRAAIAVMQGGCSDDGFEYFRGWLVAQGKDVFMNALENPDSLAGAEAAQAYGREQFEAEYWMPMSGYQEQARFEDMLYVAAEAYESKPGPGDFYKALNQFPFTDSEKAEIAGEVKYAADTDTRWHKAVGAYESYKLHKELLPNLVALFNQPIPDEPAPDIPIPEKTAGKESVIAKIRASKASAKSAPDHQPQKNERVGHKKTHEMEV